MKKVNETIDVVCIWIQKRLDADQCDTGHDVSEMVKALAELISASAKHKRMPQLHQKDGITFNATQRKIMKPINPRDTMMHDFSLPPDDILYGNGKGDQ